MSHNISAEATDAYTASLIMRPSLADVIHVSGLFHVEHWRDGEKIWEDDFKNLWTTVGKNLTLDTILGNSAAGAVVMGLKGTGSAAAGDTQASHAGWLEVGTANAPTYSGTRKTPSFSAASASSKTTSANVSFGITGTGTVAGAFINIAGSSAIDNTTGTLFSAGDFSSARSVVNTDTITVGYTATLT